jgi:phosphoglycerate kinase
MIIGGGMTLLCESARKQKGNSICEDDKQDLALEILRLAKKKGSNTPSG